MALVVRQAGQRTHRYQYRAADGGADRRREQHGHVPGLAVVPCRNQGFGILKDLRIGRAALCRFLLGGLPALVLHPAAVEAHRGMVAERHRLSMGARHYAILPYPCRHRVL